MLEPPIDTFDNVTKVTSSDLFNGMLVSTSASSNDGSITNSKGIPVQNTFPNSEKPLEQLIHFGSMESASQDSPSVPISKSNSKSSLEQLIQFETVDPSSDKNINSAEMLILPKNCDNLLSNNNSSVSLTSTTTTLQDLSVKELIHSDLTEQTAHKSDIGSNKMLNTGTPSNDHCANDVQSLSQLNNYGEKFDKQEISKFPVSQLGIVNSSPQSIESILTKATASTGSKGNNKVSIYQLLDLQLKIKLIFFPFPQDSKRSFDFLNKSTKGNAFNFVSETMQAEMKGRKT